MRTIHIFISAALLLTYCASKEKNYTAETSSPKPLAKSIFYGEWKDTNQDKRFSNFKIYIQEDDSVKIEHMIPNGESEFYSSQLNIVDGQTAAFFYTTTVNGDKVSVKLNAPNQDQLKSECFLTDKSFESSGILDPPILCFTYDFVRVKTEP